MKNAIYEISFRCHYTNGEQTNHRQSLKLSDVPKWVEAYHFTHPACRAISIKIWFTDLNNSNE